MSPTTCCSTLRHVNFDSFYTSIIQQARKDNRVQQQQRFQERSSSFIQSTILHNIYEDSGIFAPLHKSLLHSANNATYSVDINNRTPSASGGLSSSQARLNPTLMRIFFDLLHWMEEIDKHFPRSPIQVEIHNYIFASCLSIIFPGESLLHHLPEISKYIHIEKHIQRFLFVTMARRQGKSHAIAEAAVDLLLSIPRTRGCIYSNGRRCSNEMMTKVLTILRTVCPDVRILIQNQEDLIIEGSDGTQRRLTCYPDNPEVTFFHFHLIVIL